MTPLLLCDTMQTQRNRKSPTNAVSKRPSCPNPHPLQTPYTRALPYLNLSLLCSPSRHDSDSLPPSSSSSSRPPPHPSTNSPPHPHTKGYHPDAASPPPPFVSSAEKELAPPQCWLGWWPCVCGRWWWEASVAGRSSAPSLASKGLLLLPRPQPEHSLFVFWAEWALAPPCDSAHF